MNVCCLFCRFNKEKLHSLVTERCYPVSSEVIHKFTFINLTGFIPPHHSSLSSFKNGLPQTLLIILFLLLSSVLFYHSICCCCSGDDEGEPVQDGPLEVCGVPGAAQSGARPLSRHGLQRQPVRPGDGPHALQTGTTCMSLYTGVNSAVGVQSFFFNCVFFFFFFSF